MARELLDPTGNEDWGRTAAKINRMFAEKAPGNVVDPTGNEPWARTVDRLRRALGGNLDISGNEDWARTCTKLNALFLALYAGIGPVPTLLAAPAEIAARWPSAPPITYDGVSAYSTSFDSTTLLPANPTRTIYVNDNTGNDTTGNGLTVGTAFKTLAKALTLDVAGTSTLIYQDGTADVVYRGTTGWANYVPKGDIYYVNRTGKRVVSAGTASTGAPTFTAHATLPNVWQLAIAASSVGSVTDLSTLAPIPTNAGPVPEWATAPYVSWARAAGTDPAVLTAGQFLHDGTNLYIRPTDTAKVYSVAATAQQLVIGGTTNNGRATGAITGQTIYVDGLTFVGGSLAFLTGTLDAASTPTLVARNCFFGSNQTQVGTTSSNALAIVGPWKVFLYRVVTAFAGADGLNYHDFTLNGGGPSSSPLVFEDQCIGFGAGTLGSTNTSDNASTAHEYVTIIRLNCLFADSDDNVMSDGNLAQGTPATVSWNLGVRVGPPRKPNVSLCPAVTSGQGVAYNDGCAFANDNGRPNTYSLPSATARAYFTRMPIPPHAGTDQGVYATY